MAESLYTLSILDYVVIVGVFSISALIGIISAGKSQQTGDDYFLGNRRMGMLPIAASLTVTVMSSISYIGIPAEVYNLGPKFGLMFLSKFIVALLGTTFFLPVFYRLKITSIMEYVCNRFNVWVQYIIMMAGLAHGIVYTGIVIYVPSLALSTVTGLNLNFTIVTVGVVCTFYTSMGGIKAVVWTDVFQAAVILIGFLLIIIGGTIQIGGPAEGWSRLKSGHRSELVDFNIDPTVPYTFWTIMIGGTSLYLSITAASQATMQRYNSCKTEQQAKLAAWIGILGIGIVELLGVTSGMVAYAYYANCDPLTTGRISQPDRLIPLLIMDIFHDYPGVPGIAIAGCICASLSSVSSIINAVAAIVGENIIKPRWKNISETNYAILVKVVSALFGCMSIGIAFLGMFLGTLLQLVLILGGILGAPALGVLCLGVFVPRADSRSAICGMLSSVSIGLILAIGSKITNSSTFQILPLSADGCMLDGNTTYTTSEPFTTVLDQYGYASVVPVSAEGLGVSDTVSSSSTIFGISYLYYSTISTIVTVIVGIVVSYLPGGKGSAACDPMYLSPMLQKYYTDHVSESNLDRKEENHTNGKHIGVPTELDDMQCNNNVI